MEEIPTELLEQARVYRDDFRHFARKCISIRDHNTAKIVPLELNCGQLILDAVAEKMRKEFGFVRIMFLKSRRFGGSTYVEGRFYHKTSTRPNRNAFIVAHEKESTNTLFEMTKLMQERNPIAPAIRASNEKLLRFDNGQGTGLKSEYRLATARNVDAGRSQGIHYLHMSEEAFFVDGQSLLDGLLQCLPMPPAPHELFRESTANGFGNSFQIDCFKVYSEGRFPYFSKDGITYAWKNPKKDLVLVFIPWFVHDKYQKTFDSDEDRKEFANEIKQKVFSQALMEWVGTDALKLRKRFKLSLEQLYWREWMIENQVQGSSREERKRKFQQEYPATVEEAFLTQGSNVYSKELCDDLQSLCQVPIVVGEVVDRAGQSKIKANAMGKFSLWEKPDKLQTYFMTVDPGGGIKPSHKEDNREPDPTCIDVYNHRTGVQVAQWHGHVDYGMIANIVYLIGRMFFRAPACVELMNHGYTVVKDLTELKYPMYEAKPDEPGWLTTKASKPRMVDDLGEMSRNGDVQIRCKETVSEMRTFVEENGKYNASSGCHDDRVIAAAMASQMMTMLSKKFQQARSKTTEFIGFSNIHERAKPKDDGGYQEVYA